MRFATANLEISQWPVVIKVGSVDGLAYVMPYARKFEHRDSERDRQRTPFREEIGLTCKRCEESSPFRFLEIAVCVVDQAFGDNPANVCGEKSSLEVRKKPVGGAVPDQTSRALDVM